MKKIALRTTAIVAALLIPAGFASAHAVVRPNSVGVGSFQTFTLGVPSEKPVATTGVRLVLPEGLDFVSPNVKPGWKIEVKKQPTGKQIQDEDGKTVDEQKPVEINWTGGIIPTEQRDEFVFSAKVPSSATTLNWKVYQTYADGTTVAWDQDPKAEGAKTPYSQTQTVNDLAPSVPPNPTAVVPTRKDTISTVALAISIVALVLSLANMRKRP